MHQGHERARAHPRDAVRGHIQTSGYNQGGGKKFGVFLQSSIAIRIGDKSANVRWKSGHLVVPERAPPPNHDR
ncbi:MAG: hypothetical protein VX589_11890 [Myxococcota bacterium]|nr:hypothetical protein [Myxococcota bacterium]